MRKLQAIKKAISGVDPNLTEGDVTFRAAVVLLASVECGLNSDNLAKITGYRRAEVREFGQNARRNGIWKGKYVIAENWEDEETGGTGFLLDTLCLVGFVERSKERPDLHLV